MAGSNIPDIASDPEKGILKVTSLILSNKKDGPLRETPATRGLVHQFGEGLDVLNITPASRDLGGLEMKIH